MSFVSPSVRSSAIYMAALPIQMLEGEKNCGKERFFLSFFVALGTSLVESHNIICRTECFSALLVFVRQFRIGPLLIHPQLPNN